MHLRSSFDPGGTEDSILSLFNTPQSKVKMYLVLLKDGSLIEQLDESNGNTLYKFFRKRFIDLNVVRKIYHILKRESISIIHVHQFIELLYAIILKLANPQIRIIDHKHLLYSSKDLRFYIERALSQFFATVVTVSETSKIELENTFGYKKDNIKVIYNGVCIDKSNDRHSALNLLRSFNVTIDESKFNVVMVANFVWGKDHETILKAYNSFIRTELPEVNFYFIGRKSKISEELIRNYVRKEDIENNRVVFCGVIPNAKHLLSGFDLVVMSSFSETFNKALVEAAASGKVILASDINVFKELSQGGKRFQLFATGDPFDFFQKLKSLIKHFEKASKETHSHYFLENFSKESHFQNLYKLYQVESKS